MFTHRLPPLAGAPRSLGTQVTAQQATIAEQQRIIIEQRATIAAQHEALETATSRSRC